MELNLSQIRLYVCHILQNLSVVVRLLLLVPATTCSPERSFSALRPLKTYLRSTVTQVRLNHLTVIHCNKEVTDSLDLDQLIDNWRKRLYADRMQ